MKSKELVYLVVAFLLLSNISVFAQKINGRDYSVFNEQPIVYAVVVRQSTYDDPNWQAVADSLVAKYQGQLFIWNSTLYDVQEAVAAYQPTHIGFVSTLSTASSTFILGFVWNFIRGLDDDEYCDAIWGIITGYNAEDAMNIVTGSSGFEIKTVLGGTTSCDLTYYTQGIGTSESTYGSYFVKYPDFAGTTAYTDGPTDRTNWLVTMINEGINIFNYDPVDIFYTSGHGNYNVWQLHYPDSDLEGFFRSSSGQVYGDPHSGLDTNINSTHPKIYFGLGNCKIGKISGGSSMAPSWIHSGGAYQYTGYVINEGSGSHQHGGTKAYFYKVARNYTWAEAFFLANQALKFDIFNNTPGTDPPDLNGSALYGDPALQVKMSNEGVFQEPLFISDLTINEGIDKDTVTFKITMNREGSPGFNGKWGERHPAIILPFFADNIEILYTDAIEVVVEDNFALMYVWYQGEPLLEEGETREVTFLCNQLYTGIEEAVVNESQGINVVLHQNAPNPFNRLSVISYKLLVAGKVTLKVYNVLGHEVVTLINEQKQPGEYEVEFDGRGLSEGVYFYRLSAGGHSVVKKMVLME
ncbi:MAG: T9SS type A sorting domain-containing protein [Bacteroidales bacterium]|jgi:hypothetical protein|nr:T9SS type A sorting domain-containing protein [Bacteroidales bacterium]